MKFFASNKHGQAEGKGHGANGIVSRNIGLKVLAVIFAAALWYLVVGEKISQVGLTLQLGLQGIPEDMVVVDNPTLDVEVRVEGPRFFIDDLSPSDITGSIDLTDAKEGSNTYRILPEDIKTPGGIEIAGIRPPSVDIRLERLIRNKVEVKLRLKGRAARGYRIKHTIVMPRQVEAVGTKRELKKLKRVYTEEVDITGIKETRDLKVLVDVSDTGLTGVEPDMVDVKIVVEQKKK